MLTEQNVKAGMPPDQARREALRVFGNVAGVKDDVRDNWLARFLEVAAQDVRYGVRSLRRNPGFALVIIITMALGIGANTAIFSVVNGVLLRPLPYKDGDQLVVLHHGRGDPVANDFVFSPKEMDDYRQARSLTGVVEFHNMFFNLLGRAEPERLSTGVVSANYFDVLGVQPLHGRTFVGADDAPGAPAVLVLSHKYWERSFGGDPKVVGQVFRMNDRPHTVIGVMPPVPQYPLEVDIYMPSSACPFRSARTLIENRRGRMLTAFARMRPDVALPKAQADIDIIAAQLPVAHKDFYPQTGFRAVAVPLKDDLTSNFTSTLWILLGTAGFVLLIVCASIANLLLARMVRREREISVRAALGATRSRLLRQLLTESLILAVIGGVLGLVLSAFSLKLLVTFAERFTPRADEISIDLTVLMFTLGVSVLTGLIFGSIPAFSRRIDVAPALREGGRSSQSSQRVRSALIVAQVSASFMLLIASGLTLRSLMNVQGVNPGIKTENLVTFRADMSFDKFPLTLPQQERIAKIGRYWAEFEQRLRGIPGVVDVGGGGTFPLNEQGPFATGLIREGRTYPPGSPAPRVSLRVATPDYFKTLGQPIVAGRAFAQSDTFEAPTVVMVNQTRRKTVLAERRSDRNQARRRTFRVPHRRRGRRRRAPGSRSRAGGRTVRADAAIHPARHHLGRAFAHAARTGDARVQVDRAHPRRRSAGRELPHARRSAFGRARAAARRRRAHRDVRAARARHHRRRDRRRDRVLGEPAHAGVRDPHGARSAARRRARNGHPRGSGPGRCRAGPGNGGRADPHQAARRGHLCSPGNRGAHAAHRYLRRSTRLPTSVSPRC